MTSGVIKGDRQGEARSFAVVVSQFNELVTRPLLQGCVETLREHGVLDEGISVVWVPGSFEIPLTALRLARKGTYDAVICLGAVIRGETTHFEHIGREVARGVAEVSRQTGVPVIFGVLTTETFDQAAARARGKVGNKGVEAARAALEMASLLSRLDDEL